MLAIAHSTNWGSALVYWLTAQKEEQVVHVAWCIPQFSQNMGGDTQDTSVILRLRKFLSWAKHSYRGYVVVGSHDDHDQQ